MMNITVLAHVTDGETAFEWRFTSGPIVERRYMLAGMRVLMHEISNVMCIFVLVNPRQWQVSALNSN